MIGASGRDRLPAVDSPRIRQAPDVAMLPVIAIVGRANVGKSTLFNRLTRRRDALVADQPGLTRDRRYGTASLDDTRCILIDTGGMAEDANPLDSLIEQQAWLAIEESDVVLFIVDVRAGLTSADEQIARELRRADKPVFVTVNKAEGMEPHTAAAEFHRLGLGQPWCVSAAHGHGIDQLFEQVLQELPVANQTEPEAEVDSIRVAITGRPNVGKSTLVNRILGVDRMLTFDTPGTTRDSIESAFERDGQAYTLIDTAGIRRRARIDEQVEHFSVVKAFQAIEDAHVALMVLDASETVTEQDASLLGLIIESGKAIILAVNKWDGLDADKRSRVLSDLERKLHFMDYAPIHTISALHGSGVGKLFPSIRRVWRSAFATFNTTRLTRILEDAVDAHPPPMIRGRRIKLRYAHQGGQNPPRIIIHGNQTKSVPDSYRRYLSNCYRSALKLEGTPVRIEFKQNRNPYKSKRNLLTPRQQRSRERMLRHVKKK